MDPHEIWTGAYDKHAQYAYMSNFKIGFPIEYVSSFGTQQRRIRTKFKLEHMASMPNMPTGQIWNSDSASSMFRVLALNIDGTAWNLNSSLWQTCITCLQVKFEIRIPHRVRFEFWHSTRMEPREIWTGAFYVQFQVDNVNMPTGQIWNSDSASSMFRVLALNPDGSTQNLNWSLL